MTHLEGAAMGKAGGGNVRLIAWFLRESAKRVTGMALGRVMLALQHSLLLCVPVAR